LPSDQEKDLLEAFSKLLGVSYHLEENTAIQRLLAICKDALKKMCIDDIVLVLHRTEYSQLLELVQQYQGFPCFDPAAKLSLKRPITWIFTHIPANHPIFESEGAQFRGFGLNIKTTHRNDGLDLTTGTLKLNDGQQWDVVIIHLTQNNSNNRFLIDTLCSGRSARELPHVVFFAGPAVHLREPRIHPGFFTIVQTLYYRGNDEPLKVDGYFTPVINQLKEQVRRWKGCPVSLIESELESSDLRLDQLKQSNLQEYSKPIDISSLAWHIADQKGDMIAWFSICELLAQDDLSNANGDCLILCLRMILELETPGKCYQLAMKIDEKKADAMSIKLTRIFMKNHLLIKNSGVNRGSVKFTYEGSWLDMWRLTKIAEREGLPPPTPLGTSCTRTIDLRSISIDSLNVQLTNKKHPDRQWVIILGRNAVRPSRTECLEDRFKLVRDMKDLFELFINQVQSRLKHQHKRFSFGIDEQQLEKWVGEYPNNQSVSPEVSRLLEVFAASAICQLFGTSWWETLTYKTAQPVELIRQLSSKKITLVTQDWHSFTEQLWGFRSMSVEEAIKNVRTDSVTLDLQSLEGKVVHLLGSFSQPETLLPSFASALVTENSAAFLLGLFNSLKTIPELRIAIIGTDEDEELREGLAAWYRSTRPDINIEEEYSSDEIVQKRNSLEDKILFFTSKFSLSSRFAWLFKIQHAYNIH